MRVHAKTSLFWEWVKGKWIAGSFAQCHVPIRITSNRKESRVLVVAS